MSFGTKSRSCSPLIEKNATRRDFLKTGLATSIAMARLSAAAQGEKAINGIGSPAERRSLIRVTGEVAGAPLRKPWKSTIATGHAHLLLRSDLQSHLSTLQRAIGYRYCRFHGLFHDDMGVAVRRENGALTFRWAQVDKIFDALLQLGLRPHVELSSMPEALASGSTTIDYWKWNVTPPRNYAEWGQLVGAFARHCLDRYGLDEISQWYYEVWNEPNINFWTGTQDDYWKLYDASVEALKRVSPRLRVGGPVTARAAWIPELISHCSSKGIPLDFISTHIYPQDEYVEYPNLKGSPYKPGEFVPGILREVQRTVRASAMPDLEIQWTEWNSLVPLPDGRLAWDKNPSVDNLSAAATVCDLAIAADTVCETFCWWEASDVFEENGMPQTEFSGTYGLLTLNGLRKATFNAFGFLNRLRGSQLEVRHEQLAPGRGLVATAEGESRQILLWHRVLPGMADELPWTGVLEIPWTDAAKPVLVQERIASEAGSCYETWLSLGTPQDLSPVERNLLEIHSVPEGRLFQPEVENQRVMHDFRLAPGEVLYLELRPQGTAAISFSSPV
jgi:xylan 1,4-beta-xylosidase